MSRVSAKRMHVSSRGWQPTEERGPSSLVPKAKLALSLVPKGQPEISQGRSPWRNYLRPEGTLELPLPSTHLSLHYHVVFSTKDRQPLIAEEWRGRLFEYLGGLIRAAEGIPEAVGGTTDHVHMLIGLRATHTLASFIQDIKQTSSHWVHETIGLKSFSWQPGYGAFTVSVSNREAVREYIAHQADHHRIKTFQEEYVAFLNKHGVTYDARFLW